MVEVSLCTIFQVCIVFHWVRGCDTNRQTDSQTNMRMNIRISPTGCSPHVDFDYQIHTKQDALQMNLTYILQLKIPLKIILPLMVLKLEEHLLPFQS